MTWEWAGPVATAVVGIAGLGATVWVARQGRQHAEYMASEATRSTLTMAREARSQERVEAAYRRLLEVATETTSFVTYADVVWKRDAKPPDIDEVADELTILLSVYASKDMRDSYAAWQASIEKLRDLLGKVPPDKRWYDSKKIAEQFRRESDNAEYRLAKVYEVARNELV